MCARCNVVVVVLDAARADHFGTYGYPRPTTPFIDSFAAQSVVFERASSEASYTIASVASLLSGLPAASHRVESVADRLSPAVETLAEALRRNGYRTGAFTENPLIDADLGLVQGFDTFTTWGRREEAPVGADFDVSDAPAHVDEVVTWLRGDAGPAKPFFLYVHLLRPHQPYVPLPAHAGVFRRPYAGALRGSTHELLNIEFGHLHPDADDRRHLVDLYDENLRSADWLVERLVTGLRRYTAFDETIVFITADHGEELFDHGGVLHGDQVYEESIHVPLLVRVPPRLGIEPHRQRTLAQLRDVVPTVMRALGLPLTAFSRGLDLLPAMRTRTEVLVRPDVVSRGTRESKLIALRSGSLKYVSTRRGTGSDGRLFDLASDPKELHDVARQRASERDALADRLQTVLRMRRRASFPSKNEQPADVLRQSLRALGYAE